MEWKDEYEEILDEKNVNIIDEYKQGEETYLELQFYTNAGEDFSFTVSKENFVNDVFRYSEEFDPEEHAEMWVEAKHDRSTNRTDIPHVFTLFEDAKWIQSFLKEIAEKVRDRRNELCTSS